MDTFPCRQENQLLSNSWKWSKLRKRAKRLSARRRSKIVGMPWPPTSYPQWSLWQKTWPTLGDRRVFNSNMKIVSTHLLKIPFNCSSGILFWVWKHSSTDLWFGRRAWSRQGKNMTTMIVCCFIKLTSHTAQFFAQIFKALGNVLDACRFSSILPPLRGYGKTQPSRMPMRGALLSSLWRRRNICCGK